MKIKSTSFHSAFIISLIIALLTGCVEFDVDSMKLTNDTSQITYYQAMTVESFYLTDSLPKFLIESSNRRKRIIPSGETVTIYMEDISGYSLGDDVIFSFYEVIGDSAYLSGGLELTHKQLKKLRFHVVIDDKEHTTRVE